MMNTDTHSPTPPRREGLLIAAALLVAYGAWSLMTAAQEHSVGLTVAGVVALHAALGLLRSRPWARFFMYGFSVLLIGTMTSYLYRAVSLGDYSDVPLPELATALAPGLGLVVLTVVGSVAVRAYFRALGPPSEDVSHELEGPLGVSSS